jgi:hypothetical protein
MQKGHLIRSPLAIHGLRVDITSQLLNNNVLSLEFARISTKKALGENSEAGRNSDKRKFAGQSSACLILAIII